MPANIGTPTALTLGTPATDSIDTPNSLDWFTITLTAGDYIDISADGITLSDTMLTVYNDNGTRIAFDDDSGPGLNSNLSFTASYTGTYYVQAAGYGGLTGSYLLSTAVAERTTYTPTDSIDWGTRMTDTTIDVFFGGPGYTTSGYTSEGFNAYEIAQFERAFALISSVANVSFNTVNTVSESNFRLVLDTNQIGASGFLGFFEVPNGTNIGDGVFNGAAWDRVAGGDLEVGGNGFVTIVHELLHGLGLAHPHDLGGSSNVMEGVTNAFDSYGQDDLNQGVYTTMSYNSGLETGGSGTTPPSSLAWGFEAGPMALDIAVLQDKYGANTNTGAGSDTYTLASVNAAGTYWQSIWDASGIDTIQHTGTQTATIDLRPATLEGAEGGGGYLSSVQGIAGGYTVAAGVVIENATGGNGQDVIHGNDVGNLLIGDADTVANMDVFAFRTSAREAPAPTTFIEDELAFGMIDTVFG